MFEAKSTDLLDDEAVRSSLRSMLWVGCPTLFGLALASYWVDHAGATPARTILLLVATAYTCLTAWWGFRPPKHAHRAVALLIVILQLCLVALLRAVPEPTMATAQIIIAVGAAFFLRDLHWMLSVQAFGLACWLLTTGSAEPTPQWQIARLVTLVGYAAAMGVYLGHGRATHRIHQLDDERQELDIEARASARALRASELRLRNAQRIAHVGSFEWDIETDELHWSEEHYRIFGLESNKVQADNALFLERVHPDDRDTVVRAVAASLRDGTSVEIEFRIQPANGEERVLYGRAETAFDESGKPILHSGTSVDMTDRHQAEQALRASQERMHAVLTAMETTHVVLVARDGALHSILADPPGRTDRYGIEGEALVGRTIEDLVPGDDGTRVLAAVETVYATGQPAELEAGIALPGGTFHFDVSLRPLRSSSGEIEFVIGIVRDITQHKADALALRQAETLESLGVLAGGIAHDFNNLLVGILGNAEIALDRLDEGSALRQELDDIVRAGTQAADLTRELLAYAGSARIESEPIDLAALVEETAQLARPGLAAAVEVQVDCGSESVWINADATQIRQVLMNFILNAADAMADQDGRVRVRTDVVKMDRSALESCTISGASEPGEYCRVDVSDLGVGMDPETLGKIFDPFFTTKFQGRGLGLASTMGIVRAHHGAIQVDSQLGRGSNFTMFVPRVAPVEAKQSAPEPRTNGVSDTILVVGDEALIREVAQRLLEGNGYRVLQASSGSRAAELAASDKAIRLALVDLTMPGMDGEQTFEALRTIDADLPVLFMSGHSSEEVSRRISGMARSSHITKPFRMNVLNQAVSALLDDSDA